jgi:hypothetical protein
MNVGNKLKNENFFVVQAWMLTKLGLKGNELLIYAIIYGFSQGGENQAFCGSISYLCQWTNSTRQSVMANLKALCDKGFLTKKEKYVNNVKMCEYRAVDYVQIEQKNLRGVVNFFDRGSQIF